MIRSAILGLLIAFTGVSAAAEQIRLACLQSDKSGGNRALCGCIQDAADLTLTAKDQRLAATFFEDPNRAQRVRQSNSRSNTAFWERYRSFGETAESFCRS